jgi:hypothetical protein
MNITDIKNTNLQVVEYQQFTPTISDLTEKNRELQNAKNIISDKNDISKPTNWQQEILLQGLDFLDNKIQVSNNGTLLDKAENQPIESFEEALSVLQFIKSDLFAMQAADAQANISPKIVFDLLTEI